MNTVLIRPLAAAFVACAALAACNGTNYANVYPTPGPSSPCVLPSTFAAIYPANYAIVPASINTVYVASQQTNLANGNLNTWTQPPNNASAFPNGAFYKVALSQIPMPRATPGFKNPVYYASNLGGGLLAGGTYGIAFNNSANGNCNPVIFMSFTTR